MNLDKMLTKHGITSANLARALGVSAGLVSQWRHGVRPIAVERCAALEKATGGVITRHDLRPKDWHIIWPELQEREDTAQ